MYVIGRVDTWGVEGKKIKELKEFLKKNVEYRYVKDRETFDLMKKVIFDKVKELNLKYRNTVDLKFTAPISGYWNQGEMRFTREGASHAILYLPVLNVNLWNCEEHY